MKPFRTFLFLAAFLGLAFGGRAQKSSKPLIKRTYYDYQNRQLHEEYQYVSTPTNRFSKQGYYKEYNEDGTLWRKHQYRNNKAEGRQLEYATTDGETWLEYDMMVHNALLNGPYLKYAGPGDKLLAGQYLNGEKAGTWIEYGSDGSQRATYYVHDEPYTGTLEERFASGKLSRSVEYYKGMRFGLTQSWYASGQLKSQTHYQYDKPDSATLRYAEDGEPDADTKALLAEETARIHAQRADSLQQAQASVLLAQRQARNQRHLDSVQRENTQRLAARRREADNLALASTIVANAQVRRNTLAKANAGVAPSSPGAANSVDAASGAAVSLLGSLATSAMQRHPQKKLYLDLYDQLLADYEAAPNEAKLAKSQRLQALMLLAEALCRGEQPELNKAIRKENDLTKVLALTGL